MARSSSLHASNALPHAPPSPASNGNRVTKSRSGNSSCMTRQRKRMLTEASNNGTLEDMVNDAQVVAGSSASSTSSGKGKGRASDVVHDGDEWEEYDLLMVDATEEESQEIKQEDVCPITDKDTKPFPIMDLPTEIRLEIYRACLTRPYNILLSRREQPAPVTAEEDTTGKGKDGRIVIDGAGSDDEAVAFTRPRRTASASQNHQSSARRFNLANGIPRLSSRSTRPIRMPVSRPSIAPIGTNANSASASTGARSTNTGVVFSSRPSRRATESANKQVVASGPERPQNQDPLIVNVMLASKDIYKEARSVLYGENLFTLDLATAMPTLACLHQRSRRQIKHVELEIPTYNEILERFQETVRLSLRYCSGLKKIVIHMPFTLPGADGSGTTGNTTVYANGFDILRWLPQECNVILKGNICTEIETVVNKHLHLAKTLDKNAYARRQLISNDTGHST